MNCETTLGKVLLEIHAGKSFQTAEVLARPDELGVLKVSAVTWSKFRPEEAKSLKDPYLPSESHRVKKGDFLISRANTKEFVGAVVHVENDYPFRLLSDKTLRLVLDEDRVCKEYLLFAMRASKARDHIEHFATGTSDSMRNISHGVITSTPIDLPRMAEQRRIAHRLKSQMAEAEKAHQAATAQLNDVSRLADAIVFDSIERNPVSAHSLGDVLLEIKKGIGKTWSRFPVLGATRNGLALAKEQPGKMAERYKPAFAGTVFYNPMRILIGSIAFVDEDDLPGITSPDYVALQGKTGVVDSRWFYFWLRSPLGVDCINSLARGAVRERMLFNRLADGTINLPNLIAQEKAASALKDMKSLQKAIRTGLSEIELLPPKLLSRVFES